MQKRLTNRLESIQYSEAVLIGCGYQIKKPYFCAGLILLTRLHGVPHRLLNLVFTFSYTVFK
jgi:hypothetical protein